MEVVDTALLTTAFSIRFHQTPMGYGCELWEPPHRKTPAYILSISFFLILNLNLLKL
jgi:hypothetical protein